MKQKAKLLQPTNSRLTKHFWCHFSGKVCSHEYSSINAQSVLDDGRNKLDAVPFRQHKPLSVCLMVIRMEGGQKLSKWQNKKNKLANEMDV